MENATIAFERSKKLFADKVISQAEYEQAELAYKTAKAEIEIAKESVTGMEYTVKVQKPRCVRCVITTSVPPSIRPFPELYSA